MAYPPYGHPTAGYPGVAPAQAYFFIRSRLNGLVMDVEGGNRNPGARVVMWNQKGGDVDNQLWYDDYQTGTIRSKLNGFCLDIAGDTLVLNPFYPGNQNQQWMRADPFIQHRMTPNRVIDIAENNSSPGARLIAYSRNGGQNQMFDFQFVGGAPSYPTGPSYPPAPSYPAAPTYPAYPPAQPSYPAAPPAYAPPARGRFFIVSAMHGKVLDIEGANRAPGAHVILWPRKMHCDNQLWYLDAQGIIRSAFNDFAIEAHSDGEHVRMMPFSGKSSQRWMFAGNKIVRDHKNCLDIEGANQGDGAKVIQWNYKGSNNQHWRIDYV